MPVTQNIGHSVCVIRQIIVVVSVAEDRRRATQVTSVVGVQRTTDLKVPLRV